MAGGSVVLTVMCSFRRYRDSLVSEVRIIQSPPSPWWPQSPYPSSSCLLHRSTRLPGYLPQLQEAKAKKKVKLDEKAAAALTSTPQSVYSTNIAHCLNRNSSRPEVRNPKQTKEGLWAVSEAVHCGKTQVANIIFRFWRKIINYRSTRVMQLPPRSTLLPPSTLRPTCPRMWTGRLYIT